MAISVRRSRKELTDYKRTIVVTKKFKPTDDERTLVSSMVAVGIPQDHIALVLRDGIAPKTLRLHFRRELDTAKIKANAKIGGTLYKKAMAGDTTAAIFWAKTQMGWKETNVQENTGKDGEPLILWGSKPTK
jgi:hypothetical protein